MPDDEVTAGAAGDAPPPGGAHSTGEGQEPPAGRTTDDTDEQVAQLRKEAASWRRKLREQETANLELAERLSKLEAGNSTDDVAARATELEQSNAKLREQLRSTALAARVASLSVTLQVRDPDAALALLNHAEVEWDGDQPDPDTVRTALEGLLDRKPYLRADSAPPPATAPAGTGAPAGGHQPPPAANRETLDERRRRLYGGIGSSAWDPQEAERRGGGVIT